MFRLKFPIRLGENQFFVVVRFLAAPCSVFGGTLNPTQSEAGDVFAAL